MSGKYPTAGVAPFKKDRLGTWLISSPGVRLSNTVTDADGDQADLTFEVWTADASGQPGTKVNIADNKYGVIVSAFAPSGSNISVNVPVGKLTPNTDYVFHTSAFDGKLYETAWSPWAHFRIELPVDLTLPAPDFTAPRPSWDDVPPSSKQTKPLGSPTVGAPKPNKTAPQCGPPAADGRRVCFGPSADKPAHSGAPSKNVAVAGDWCDTSTLGARATRRQECDLRKVSVRIMNGDKTEAETFFFFLRKLDLNGNNSFNERLTFVPAEKIPAAFVRIDLKLAEHLCQDPCTPGAPGQGDWTATPSWTPGDGHSASVDTQFTWAPLASGREFLAKPDVKIDADIYGAYHQAVGYQWSKGYWDGNSDLDQVRCDNRIEKIGSGCVFVNAAPTYPFNARNFPQAAAHAWLIQTKTPNHPGSEIDGKPLYYMGIDKQNDINRGRICPSGWAAKNGDASARDDATDSLNCDEFAFASTYNSGGMATSEGGLNPAVPAGNPTSTPSGALCIQTFAKQQGANIHLYNIDGAAPTFTEPCGRSAISGHQNQQSMGGNFNAFMESMRILDKDAYWLDTRMSAVNSCLYGAASGKGEPVICKLTAR